MDDERLVWSVGEAVQGYVTWATSPMNRIPTGFDLIDSRASGGPATGELAMFLARPNVGKTVWGLNLIANNRHVPSVFISLEMQKHFVVSRLAAMTYGQPTWEMERAVKTYGITPVLEQLSHDYGRLALVDQPGLNLDTIYDSIEQAEVVLGEPPKMVVLDYMELIGGAASASEADRVYRLSIMLKNIARMTDTLVVVLHQVGREHGGNGERPLGMNAGRYGGEQAADYMIGAYRPCLEPGLMPDRYQALVDQFYLQLLKNRGGGQIHPSGVVHRIDEHTMRITAWNPPLYVVKEET